MKAHFHFKLFKPYGYLSQFVYNQNTRKNKHLLGELFHFPEATMAIGRLDETSEGLLLLTTDGKLSYEVLSKKVEKEYYVQVDGLIHEEAIDKLKNGVEINIHGKAYQTLSCKAKKLETIPDFPKRTKSIRNEKHGPTSWISITLNEGKFRQVRKMTAKVGFPTLRLVRYRIGNETCEGMKAGEVQQVNKFNYA
ncbi:pseudouridine synthase [Psychroflexus salis]|uniref:Pseudouridine synthase n=1 Tax=Psychroflexus salis TaxID=1526574 RepID=A0A916ZY48_9FLAO|nr:pseudouridine synthase [Psychroflexus salis]GGE17589.1 pseudouridine synthase [Psychroflexus salis]